MERRPRTRPRQSMRRRVSAFLGTVALVLAGLVGPGGSSPALAATSCNGSGNYLDGFYNYGTNGMKGISDSVFVRDGALCEDAPDGAFWSGWSAVTGHNGVGYAQSGFDYTAAPGNPFYDRDFAQSNLCNFCMPDDNFTMTRVYPGSAYSYWTDIEVFGQFYMYDTFTRLLISSFNSIQLQGPFGYQLMGETSDTGDDTPGLTATRMGHTHLRWLNGATWSLTLPAPTVHNDNTARWATNPTGHAFNTCIDGYKCAESWTSHLG